MPLTSWTAVTSACPCPLAFPPSPRLGARGTLRTGHNLAMTCVGMLSDVDQKLLIVYGFSKCMNRWVPEKGNRIKEHEEESSLQQSKGHGRAQGTEVEGTPSFWRQGLRGLEGSGRMWQSGSGSHGVGHPGRRWPTWTDGRAFIHGGRAPLLTPTAWPFLTQSGQYTL